MGRKCKKVWIVAPSCIFLKDLERNELKVI